LTFKNKPNALVLNAGIESNRTVIGEIIKGEKYFLRIKYKTSLMGDYASNAPSVKIAAFHYDNQYYVLDDVYFNFNQVS
jgi:hypothetical protein